MMGPTKDRDTLISHVGISMFFLVTLMSWVLVIDALGVLQDREYVIDDHQRQPQISGIHELQAQVSFQDRFKDGLCKLLVEPHGYPCEEYTVQTNDGFKLTIQHIPHGLAGSIGSKETPVFLQHGIMAGGEGWLLNGPNESFAFILADLGFDVWIGNSRGVEWSHGHESLNSSDPAFWDWTFDELAAYDLPAMMEFVYNKTSQKIMYVGHSMGTTILLAALIEQAAHLVDIVRGAVFVCPVALLTHVTSTFDQVAAHLFLDQVYNLFHISEFDLHSDVVNFLIDTICAVPNLDCTQLLPNVAGEGCCVDKDKVPLYLQYYPQPSSTKIIAHYAQILRKGPFRKYDFGRIQNVAHYNQSIPPEYAFSKFPSAVPLLMVSGTQDAIANTVDVAIVTQSLQQSVQGSVILPQYSHVDFILSRTANVDFWLNVTTWFESLISL
ncbi:lysosomal acid lipase/cholesteryl ester hydrolase [Marchantia polymorpha subsp. ruderalis]|uniref:Lipase n=2 Tax=Marchantia polymorpha TaxID=3197 RepID=A0A176W4I6_MARPO|nr:hypothetical protein AXG93_2015s1010 [Marchantia polymorpha subsp. ruderalis]PTQ39021.1 hypothetical protein MARPO_0047s0013 [Marchantia polymorpha]BBN14683.1 hypothetical protein Mp_6g13620 [Marchantia polymorpha subsp. ruderalis]|eukprot:PTQ39021.1 hypothetical protein MARPO_0047s0013 [Marchantia polymorpha]